MGEARSSAPRALDTATDAEEPDEPNVRGLSAPLARMSGVRLPRTFSALRTRNYRIYWTGQLVSLCGTWMQTTAQNWLIYQLTLSPLYLGLLNFANQAPTLVFSLFAGVLADRVSKRQMLITTQFLAMIQATVLATLVLTGNVRAEYVIVLALVLGIINAFDNPVRQSFIPEIVPRADMMNAIALGATAFNGARIIGPALGGLVVAALGAGGAFAINAVSFLAVLAGLFMIQVTPRAATRPRESVWTSLRDGIGYIRGNRAISTLLLQASVVGIFAMPYNTLMPVMAGNVLGLGVGGYGLLMSFTGIGAVAGALTLASLGNFPHKGRIVSICDFGLPIMLALFSLSRITILSMLLLSGFGFFLIMRNATSNTLLQTAVPDHLRGRVIAAYMFMFMGMMPIGALQSGLVAQRFGAPFALLLGAGVLLFSALLVLWRRPEVRRLA
jgi:MFS family permease